MIRGGQKNWTERSQTEPAEQKPIQTERKSILNHSVKYFPNPNSSVRFKTNPNGSVFGLKPNRTKKPMCFCNYLKILEYKYTKILIQNHVFSISHSLTYILLTEYVIIKIFYLKEIEKYVFLYSYIYVNVHIKSKPKT